MNEDLLVTWKDIAAYLKCSVRKAQRLERQQLPVRRIPKTKAVWASKAEIDQWLDTQSATVAEDPASRATARQFRFPGQLWILASGDHQVHLRRQVLDQKGQGIVNRPGINQVVVVKHEDKMVRDAGNLIEQSS